MKLLYHVEEKSGYQSVIDESCDVLEYNRFDFLRLGRGETCAGKREIMKRCWSSSAEKPRLPWKG
jgi:hypothetical protein